MTLKNSFFLYVTDATKVINPANPEGLKRGYLAPLGHYEELTFYKKDAYEFLSIAEAHAYIKAKGWTSATGVNLGLITAYVV